MISDAAVSRADLPLSNGASRSEIDRPEHSHSNSKAQTREPAAVNPSAQREEEKAANRIEQLYRQLDEMDAQDAEARAKKAAKKRDRGDGISTAEESAAPQSDPLEQGRNRPRQKPFHLQETDPIDNSPFRRNANGKLVLNPLLGTSAKLGPREVKEDIAAMAAAQADADKQRERQNSAGPRRTIPDELLGKRRNCHF